MPHHLPPTPYVTVNVLFDNPVRKVEDVFNIEVDGDTAIHNCQLTSSNSDAILTCVGTIGRNDLEIMESKYGIS